MNNKRKNNNIKQKRKTTTIKRKKRRLRKGRVLLVLLVFIFIIVTIKFISYLIYNHNIYNTITNNKTNIAKINIKKDKLKLSNKNINYINKKLDKIKIKNDDTIITILGKNVKNNMNLDFTIYNKKIKNKNFNNSKSLYIENSSTLKKSINLKIKLPGYLRRNNIVDIYGIDNKEQIKIIKKSVNIKDKYVTFNLSKKYSKYFITYVKVTDIKIDSDIEVLKKEELNFKIKYEPTASTIKEVTYDNLGDNFVMRNDNLVAKKIGKFKITLKVKNSNIKKNVNIIVKENNPKIEKKDGLTYVNGILIVNKTYSLPKDYDPGSLKKETVNAYNKMKEAAKKDNINLFIASGYRSYETQDELYNYYVKIDGKKKADTYSARPGFSEHQTGYAMDLNIVDSSFEGTPEAIWIANNSYKYGFIIRYPKGKESITGYKYEPWHVRYLGKELAKKVYDSNLTLEEYLNIESKYSSSD